MRIIALAFMHPEEIRKYAIKAQGAILGGARAEPLHELWIYNMLYHGVDSVVSGTSTPPANYTVALDDALRDGDVERQVEVLYHVFTYAFGGGDYPGALAAAQQAKAIAIATGNDQAILHTERLLSQALHFSGAHAEAIEAAQSVLARADEKFPVAYASSISRHLSMRILLARAYWILGEGSRALALVQASESFVADEEHPGALCQLLALASCPITIWQGEDALPLVARLRHHANSNGLEYWVLWADRYQGAIDGSLRQKVTGRNESEAKLRDHLATLGTLSPFLDTVERANNMKAGWCAAEVLRGHGEALLASEMPEEVKLAESLFIRSLIIARDQGAVAWALRAATSLARLWQRSGRFKEAFSVLSPWCERSDGTGKDYRAAIDLLKALTQESSCSG